MKFHIAAGLAALSLAVVAPAGAQTSTETKVSTGTSVKDGVATTRTKTVHTRKTRTHRPKKILGVKVGSKTVTHQTVKETSMSSDGSHSTTVKTK